MYWNIWGQQKGEKHLDSSEIMPMFFAFVVRVEAIGVF
jgi:hypothetical protein